MRVNIYAEEMTDRVEIIGKEIDGHVFTGLRFYLELPVTVGGEGQHRTDGESVYAPINGKPAQVSGPFIHRPGDDDSAAVTFWGKRDLRDVLRKALAMLDEHYAARHPVAAQSEPTPTDDAFYCKHCGQSKETCDSLKERGTFCCFGCVHVARDPVAQQEEKERAR